MHQISCDIKKNNRKKHVYVIRSSRQDFWQLCVRELFVHFVSFEYINGTSKRVQLIPLWLDVGSSWTYIFYVWKIWSWWKSIINISISSARKFSHRKSNSEHGWNQGNGVSHIEGTYIVYIHLYIWMYERVHTMVNFYVVDSAMHANTLKWPNMTMIFRALNFWLFLRFSADDTFWRIGFHGNFRFNLYFLFFHFVLVIYQAWKNVFITWNYVQC